jgi:hypothetical protein
MIKQFTALKYCKWCGDPFEVKSPNQQYCLSDLKNCSQEAKRESWRRASDKYRKKYKNFLSISSVYKLGSGFLGSKPKKDFDKEHLAVQKEMERLRINGMLAGVFLWIQLTCPLFMRNILQRESFSVIDVYPQLIVLIILVAGFLIFGSYQK